MTRAMLPLIRTTTNSILPKISCKMEGPRVISGFKRVAWPELRRLPLTTAMKNLPAGIEQVRHDIEREAVSIMKKHGLQFEDEEQHCSPQMEMRGVPEKSSTGLPTILILAPWSTEKQRDWETAAQEMAMFLDDLSRVCSFSETDIHVEIMAPELVQRTYYTNIDDLVFQKQLKATPHASLSRICISVSYDSDEPQWHEAVTEVKRTLDTAEWSDVQVHVEHNEGMIGYFENFTSPTTEQMNRGYKLKKRIEDEYYSTVHIGDDFGAARYIKRTDGERLSPTNGTIGCFVQLKASDPEPTGGPSSLHLIKRVAPPIANSDLWTIDSVGYTPHSSAKPTAFESPSQSKHHFNIRDIDERVAGLTNHIQYWEKKDWPIKEKQPQRFRGRMAALRDERKQKTEFFEVNKQALGRLYAASGFRRRVVGRRMDWALIEFDRPWRDRLPEHEEWESPLSILSTMPYMTYGMQLEEQTRSIEALSGLAWSSSTFDVYKIGTSGGPRVGSRLCTNNLVTIRDDQYMNPLPTEEMALEPKRYICASERGFCAPGDSGSVVFDESGGIVGLMIGGHHNNNSYNHGYEYATPIGAGLSRKHIFDAVQASVKRLGTYIDVLQIQRMDPYVPREEIMKALNDVVELGLARYIGASSRRQKMPAWEFQALQNVGERNGWHKFISMQNYYDLLYREEEREMMPYCKDAGVGCIPWSPNARGVLTRPWNGLDEKTSLRTQHDQTLSRLYDRENGADKATVDIVEEVAKARGLPMAVIATAWCLHKGVNPIIGLNSKERIDEAVLAASITLTDDEVAKLESAYRPKPVTGY
ncbi:alcohol dehydrogenase [Fusarium agapanthi]|uniref:Alcohol dehydrogenase n=1 Tax=Fusarium agapanthi TaxID=1803897 RepID=A0A9P5BJV5_9HYPO|nr:alcohol dehydrogenase [Fusarium agapanthi]